MLHNTLYFNTAFSDRDRSDLFGRIKDESSEREAGYFALPASSQAVCAQIRAFEASAAIRSKENIAVIGIGGSALGTKAVDSLLSLRSKGRKRHLFFLENVDPLEITQTLSRLALDQTLFIVISKSGTTIETTSILKIVLVHFQLAERMGSLSDHFAVVTDADSALDKFAADFGIERFHIPSDVGGRFSVLSAVGLLPLYLCGYDIDALLEGARTYSTSFFDGGQTELLDKALYYYHHRDTILINTLFAYGSGFENFTKWYVQLWAESLGKIDAEGKRVGTTPVGLIGSVDQHSFLQLVMQGTRDKSITFVKVLDFESSLRIPDITLPHLETTSYVNNRPAEQLINHQCDATRQAIIGEQIPTDLLALEKIDEAHVGALLFYYELFTSLMGILAQINTYDQPGVETAKSILKKEMEAEALMQESIVITDLDGSLLDHNTYRCDDAYEMLDYLKKSGIPLIIATSKTKAEVDRLRERLGLIYPFIVENGAAIVTADEEYPLARPYPELRQWFEAQKESFGLRGFGDMAVEEIMELTGLDAENAFLAKQREYTEPFVIDDPFQLKRLEVLANDAGYSVIRGGRFYHLVTAGCDKARAMQKAIELFSPETARKSIALGDSPNDFAMLLAADQAVLIPHPDGSYAAFEAPGLIKAPYSGPKGWNAALKAIYHV